MSNNIRTAKFSAKVKLEEYLRDTYQLGVLTLFKESEDTDYYGIGEVTTNKLRDGFEVEGEGRVIQSSSKYEVVSGSLIPSHVLLNSGRVDNIKVSVAPLNVHVILRGHKDKKEVREKREELLKNGFEGAVNGITYVDGKRYFIVRNIPSLTLPPTPSMEFIVHEESVHFICIIGKSKEQQGLFQLNIDYERDYRQPEIHETAEVENMEDNTEEWNDLGDLDDDLEVRDEEKSEDLNHCPNSSARWKPAPKEISESQKVISESETNTLPNAGYLKEDGAFGTLKKGEFVSVKSEHFTFEDHEAETSKEWLHNPNTIEEGKPLFMVVNDDKVIDYAPISMIDLVVK